MNVFLPNPSTLRAHPRNSPPGFEQEKASCIACNALLAQLIVRPFDTRFGIQGEYDVWRCSRCNLEQMFPVPTPGELKYLYETYYNFGGRQGTLYTTIREWFFASSLYRAWIRLDGDFSFHDQKGRGRLIDIGCNEGRGLRIYERNGFEVEGCELNEEAAAQARERGYKVYTTPIGDLIPSVPYDVAILSNVLEHVPDPRQMLSDVHRVLSANGQVWISCPNNHSWLRTVFGKYWINWHVPFHISHFSQQTITKLLEQAKFSNIKIRQVTPALWVAMSIISQTFAREGRPTRQLRSPFLLVALLLLVRAFLFPVLWLMNRRGRGDCLLVSATKS